jgi:hypothetical protein
MPSKPTVDVNRLPFRHADTWPWRWLYRLYTSSTTLHRLVSRTKWYRGDDGGTPQADGTVRGVWTMTPIESLAYWRVHLASAAAAKARGAS